MVKPGEPNGAELEAGCARLGSAGEAALARSMGGLLGTQLAAVR